MVSKAEFLFMIQSVNLPPSAHTITSSAHCNPLQPAANHPVHTLQQPLHSSVHTAAMYSHVQLSAANLQCTLQPSTTIYTAAILSSAHCTYSIQCTLQFYYPVHTAAIPSSAHCSYTIYTVYPVHLWTTTG